MAEYKVNITRSAKGQLRAVVKARQEADEHDRDLGVAATGADIYELLANLGQEADRVGELRLRFLGTREPAS